MFLVDVDIYLDVWNFIDSHKVVSPPRVQVVHMITRSIPQLHYYLLYTITTPCMYILCANLAFHILDILCTLYIYSNINP